MPRHGENIYRRRDGRYEGRYVIGRGPSGKTRFGYVYARTYGEVRERLIRKKAEHLPDSTVRGIFRLLSAGMRCAQEDGLIPQNPCRRIRLGPPGAPSSGC